LNDGRSEQQKKVFRILEGLGCHVWLIDDAEIFRQRLIEIGVPA
jgi:hypothetical protein